MNVYKVERTDYVPGFSEDYEIIVIAEDKKHAERRARWSSYDFKHSKNLKITQIPLDEERVIGCRSY